MNHRAVPLLVLVLVLLIARPRGAAGDPAPARAALDHVQRLADAGRFSGVVLVARAGRAPVSRAWGMADAEAGIRNTVETAFNIGSINKAFTRVAIAQLAEAGLLSLDDTVAARLPGVRLAGADRITIRQLLDHRSGMGDFFGPRYTAAPPARLRELADFVPLFADQPLAFEPGTSERYSNAGYIVLGLIVERVSGQKYRDYVTARIFRPAGMTRSGWWAVDERVAHRATGYTRRAGDRELARPAPNTATLPGRPSSAGGAFATAGDLLRFYGALLAGKLLSPRWTSWMIHGSFEEPGPPRTAGRETDSRASGGAPAGRRTPEIGVAGGAPGVNAAVELAGGWTVIALSNLDPPSASEAARGAIEILLGRPRGRGPRLRRPTPPGPAATELRGDVAVPAAPAGLRPACK
jgi:CubicO group peptidase (beta-lactamase class C family)